MEEIIGSLGYIAGDTVSYEGVRSAIGRFEPDVIIVNACDARVGTGRLIMDAGDVKKTCDCKPDGTVIASHMDTVSHGYYECQDCGERYIPSMKAVDIAP